MPKVWALGDSITYGYLQNPFKGGYRDFLRTRLHASGYASDYVGSLQDCSGDISDRQHDGHIGWRIDQLADQVDAWMSVFNPDIVLLMAGHNDLGQGQDPDTVASEIVNLIWQIRLQSLDTRVFVGGITGHRDPVAQARVNTVNAELTWRIPAMNTAWVHLAPTHLVGRNHDDLVDHVHPNHCGHHKLAWCWWYAMRNAMPTWINTTESSPNPFYDVNGPCNYQLD